MRSLSRPLFLVALMTPFLGAAPIAAQAKYYGVVANLRFGCAPAPYQGLASLYPGLGVGAMVPGFDPPGPTTNRIHAVSLVEGPATPGQERIAGVESLFLRGWHRTRPIFRDQPVTWRFSRARLPFR